MTALAIDQRVSPLRGSCRSACASARGRGVSCARGSRTIPLTLSHAFATAAL